MPTLRTARHVGALLRKTFAEWTEGHVRQYGAAMAYYTFFSLAPLLVVAIALAGASRSRSGRRQDRRRIALSAETRVKACPDRLTAGLGSIRSPAPVRAVW